MRIICKCCNKEITYDDYIYSIDCDYYCRDCAKQYLKDNIDELLDEPYIQSYMGIKREQD